MTHTFTFPPRRASACTAARRAADHTATRPPTHQRLPPLQGCLLRLAIVCVGVTLLNSNRWLRAYTSPRAPVADARPANDGSSGCCWCGPRSKHERRMVAKHYQPKKEVCSPPHSPVRCSKAHVRPRHLTLLIIPFPLHPNFHLSSYRFSFLFPRFSPRSRGRGFMQ